VSDVVLVTGATGFIGSRLVQELVESGARVRVLVRRPELLTPAIRSRVEVVSGDLQDPGAPAVAVPGARTVLHLAAFCRTWSRDPGHFSEINVHAVERLLDAARRFGVERVVHVSTNLTLPAGQPPSPDQPLPGSTHYSESKRAGERVVESYAAAGHAAVIVHPTRVYGPGPLTDANALSKIIAAYLRGRFRFRIDDGDVIANYVHVADVVEGIRLAAQGGRSGAHYLLGGENLSFRQFLDHVAEISGVRYRVVALPRHAALALGYAALLYGHLGGNPPVTPGWVRSLLGDWRADSEPARRDFGYAARPARERLAETIAWIRSPGPDHYPVAA